MQVRWVDQTQYPMIVVASLSAVPQSCRTPLPNQYLDCMLLAVYTHTWPLNMRGKSVRSTVKLFLSTPLHQRLYGLVHPKTTKKTMDETYIRISQEFRNSLIHKAQKILHLVQLNFGWKNMKTNEAQTSTG